MTDVPWPGERSSWCVDAGINLATGVELWNMIEFVLSREKYRDVTVKRDNEAREAKNKPWCPYKPLDLNLDVSIAR